MKKKKKQKKTV